MNTDINSALVHTIILFCFTAAIRKNDSTQATKLFIHDFGLQK